MNIRGVTIGFSVPDLHAADTWYTELLGERETLIPVDGMKEYQLDGGTWLQLVEGPDKPALRLGVDDIEAVRLLLVKMGMSPTPIEDVPGVVKHFELDDPHGIRLGFYQEYA